MKPSLAQFTRDLRDASEHFRSLGDGFDPYQLETGKIIADRVIRLALRFETDSVTDEDLKILYQIFAPTCAWSDFGGDFALGRRIFDALLEFHKERRERIRGRYRRWQRRGNQPSHGASKVPFLGVTRHKRR